MSSLKDIDAQFDNAKIGKIPKWGIRLGISLIISIVLTVLLKPKFVTEVNYDPKTGQCQLKIKVPKVILGSLIATPIIYFLLQKYY